MNDIQRERIIIRFRQVMCDAAYLSEARAMSWSPTGAISHSKSGSSAPTGEESTLDRFIRRHESLMNEMENWIARERKGTPAMDTPAMVEWRFKNEHVGKRVEYVAEAENMTVERVREIRKHLKQRLTDGLPKDKAA